MTKHEAEAALAEQNGRLEQAFEVLRDQRGEMPRQILQDLSDAFEHLEISATTGTNQPITGLRA